MALVALDLRSTAKAGVANDPTPGMGLFIDAGHLWVGPWQWHTPLDDAAFWGAPLAIDPLDYENLGSDPLARMSRSAPRGLERRMGYADGSLPDSHLAGILAHYILGALADPTGQARVRPLRMTRSGFKLRLPGFGTLIDEPFSRNHPNFEARLAVRRASYDRHAKSGKPLDLLEKWTGFLMLEFWGRRSDDFLADLVPQRYIDEGHGHRAPASTITDDFGGTLAAWTEVDPASGGFSTSGGRLARGLSNAATTPAVMRHDTALSTDAMYAQLEQTTQPGDDRRWLTPATRFVSDAETAYWAHARESGDACNIRKVVGGTQTNLFSATFAHSWPQTVRLISDSGDNHSIEIDGTERNSGGQDTSIQDELQAGVVAHGTAQGHGEGDDFEAADLDGAPAGFPHSQAVIIG